jgi:hypothetical protein
LTRSGWSDPNATRPLTIAAIAIVTIAASRAESATAQTRGPDGQEVSESDTLTVADVRRFLDPTVMINRFEYRFQANYLPGDVRLYSHRTRPWIALNSWSAAWIRIPWINVSLPDGSGSSGVGDLSAGYGFVIHENLESRLTSAAAAFDVLMPTGDRAKFTGLDRWILQPTAALVFNPTDLFPIFLIARYQHSIADGDEPENGRVRTINLSVQRFHILPSRFFLLFIPNLFVDVKRDQTVFSFGVGAGRAMTRRLALQASYVQYILGSKTFSRGFQLGLNYFWGPNRGL